MKTSNEIQIAQVASSRELQAIRALFLEYASSLEISLCFQNFEEELATLPGKYAPPQGRLLLAVDDQQQAGCVALRPLEPGVCEMKRLYVRPAWRGHGLGRLLTKRIVAAGHDIGYKRMRLDTLNSMQAAIGLYRSLGFREIKPYYDNPSERAVFLELDLKKMPNEAH